MAISGVSRAGVATSAVSRPAATSGATRPALTSAVTRLPTRNNRGQQSDQQRGRNNNNDDDDDPTAGGAAAGTGSSQPQPGQRRERPGDVEPVIAEDDVLIPIAGILDVLDNYAFVRTTGYLSGPTDVYVSLSYKVRKYGLRKGDVVEGAVRQPREGERREKFNALVLLDRVKRARPRAGP